MTDPRARALFLAQAIAHEPRATPAARALARALLDLLADAPAEGAVKCSCGLTFAPKCPRCSRYAER